MFDVPDKRKFATGLEHTMKLCQCFLIIKPWKN